MERMGKARILARRTISSPSVSHFPCPKRQLMDAFETLGGILA